MRRILIFLSCIGICNADIIPINRLYPWSHGGSVGVSGGIPYARAITNTVSADTSGLTDTYSVIQSAINAASSNTVIYLPSGTYRIENTIRIPSGITLRGNNTNTIFNLIGNVGIVNSVGGDNPTTEISVLSGYNVGDSNLTLSASISSYYVGGMGFITQLNTPWVFPPTDPFAAYQWIICKAVSNNVVTIWPPLGMYLSNSLSPKLAFSAPANNTCLSGIEDIILEATNCTSPNPILFSKVRNCWIKNVEVRNFLNYGMYLQYFVNCEFVQNRVHDEKGGGNNHAGFLNDFGSGNLWIDNYTSNCFPGLEFFRKMSCNAAVYNYMIDAVGDAARGTIGGNMFGNHDTHAFANLFEGNKSSVYQADGVNGSSSHITLFRNWFTGTNTYQFNYRRGIDLRKYQRYYNIVGNIVGAPGLTWGYTNNLIFADVYPNWCYSFGYGGIGDYDSTGLDTAVLGTAVMLMNYNYSSNAVPIQEISAETIPSSYIYSSKPSWWPENKDWPIYGPFTTTNTLPAEDRMIGIFTTNTPPPIPPTGVTNAAVIKGNAVTKGNAITK